MTPSWRTLEREITEILRGHHYTVERSADSADLMLKLTDWDFPINFSLTTFAKDLAKRLEATNG
jgi:hypothetical protein